MLICTYIQLYSSNGIHSTLKQNIPQLLLTFLVIFSHINIAATGHKEYTVSKNRHIRPNITIIKRIICRIYTNSTMKTENNGTTQETISRSQFSATCNRHAYCNNFCDQNSYHSFLIKYHRVGNEIDILAPFCD